MENQDNIFEQIKKAAQKAETKDFDAMEKVWSRVDAKLDTKLYKKQNKNWKKIAVAAAVVGIVFIGYQFLTQNNKVQTTQNKVVVSDTIQMEKQIVIVEESKAELINEVDKKSEDVIPILPKGIAKPVITPDTITKIKSKITETTNGESENNTKNRGYLLRGYVFDAIGIKHIPKEDVKTDNNKAEAQVVTPVSSPLVVIDGVAKTHKKGSRYGKTEAEVVANLKDDEVEEVIVLKEPLYIINGVHYSEEDLFGKNPTSPYAPLDKQEIEKIEILQDKDAIAKYGKKGEKGVVIISTKNRKPALKK
jgi:hypothetical protein